MTELLAPVGGMNQLKAALRFGADAVYGGMSRYGLRAFAANFDEGTLGEAVALTHAAGKKFYITLNLLPFDRDMEGYIGAARQAANAGCDAAIVSDIGATLALREHVPKLPVHASTQANILNTRTALLWHQMGAERVVLAREMTLADIAAMRAKLPPDLQLEAFVHGAMCVAYSGRCLLSAALTGRSANRGECAQACRWKYRLTEEKRPGQYLPIGEEDGGTYLLSSYDLCMLEHLPEMLAAGVCSLKIEGRMKSAYYVATVVSAYRRALDALARGEDEYRALLPELHAELDKASHRPGSTGFYFGAPTPPAGADGFEQSMEFVGEIATGAQAGEPAEVLLKNRFYVGDAMEALTPSGSRAFTAEWMELADTGERVETAGVAGTRLRMAFPFAVEAGDLLRGPNRNHVR